MSFIYFDLFVNRGEDSVNVGGGASIELVNRFATWEICYA